MFCDFYFNSDYSLEEQKYMISNHFIHQAPVRVRDTAEEIWLRNNQTEGLIIICDAFSMELTSIEDYQKYREEEYGIKIDTHIYFEIYNGVGDWDEEMMRVVNYLMKTMVCDCVLEYYGISVMKKKDGNIVIEESLTGRTKKLLFDILNCV